MKHIKSILTLLFLVFLMSLNSEAEAIELHSQTATNQDSLVLKKHNSERRIVIRSGEKVKVWLTNNFTEAGELKSVHHDTLILVSHGIERMVLLNNIEKIKIYASPVGRVVGGLFTIVGVGGMVFGGITLIVGTLALFADSIAAVILVATPVLLGGGYGFYKGGSRLSGKKLNLNSKWSIEPNKN